MSYLMFLDIFGVEFKQQIQINVKAQKSIVGGLASLLILGASFAYLIYVFNEWIQFRLLPKSTNTMRVDQTSELIYDEIDNLFEFYYWKYTDQQMDPFQKVNNILTPIGLYFNNGTPSKTFSLLNYNESISNYGTQKFGLNDITLRQNYQNTSGNIKELMIAFIKCNQTYLTEGQSCSTDEEFENFFNYVNFIFFSVNLKQFNQITQSFEFVKKSFYFSIDRNIATQGQILLKPTNAIIDNGIMFQSIQEETFVQDAQIITLSSSINLWQNILGTDSFFHMMFRLEPISTELHIAYPKLGEVLAQVGSITNMLMLIRYLILFYNEKILENNFIDQVLSFYFSNYLELRKSKVKYNKKACQQLVEQAQKKLVYLNIIYELSRIQLFLQNQFGRNKLKETHQLGIQLLSSCEVQNCPVYQIYDEVNNSQKPIDPSDPNAFLVEDFFLLSMPKTERYSSCIVKSKS